MTEPSVTPATVTLPPLAAPVDELWHLLLDMNEAVSAPWTLIGGQMVLLHALEHGVVPPQISQDGDVIADVRADPAAIHAIVGWLDNAGFSLDGVSPQMLAHRYVCSSATSERPIVVDVLAPDGVGDRTDLSTTPPGRTVQVPGGSQALHRTKLVTVTHEDRTGRIPRPSLLAAIVSKAAALDLPGDPARHHRDLALLLCLLPDPFEAREQTGSKDRHRLRAATALLDEDHIAWTLAPTGRREAGHAALRILLDP